MRRPLPLLGMIPATLLLSLGLAGAEELTLAHGISMVRIPGGEFRMGSEDGDTDSKPVHLVRVADFFIGRTEVTQRQWAAVMGRNPSHFRGCDNCPVEKVSWDDVQVFLRKLREQTGKSFRLPTEAEWEYAAGGGAAHQKWAGTDLDGRVEDYAWCKSVSGGQTHPVCTKRANTYGLCDMSGNVWEWCADWYQAAYYASSPDDNPPGPPEGSFRVNRGGCWNIDPWTSWVTFRDGSDPAARNNCLGFRLALAVER